MEKQKDKKLTRKFWLQAGGLMFITAMSWLALTSLFGVDSGLDLIQSIIKIKA